MATLQIVVAALNVLLLVRDVSGQSNASTYYVTMHQKQLTSSIVNDNSFDVIVVINVGSASTQVHYVDYRTGNWLRGTLTSFTPLQHQEISVDAKVLISYDNNDEDLVIFLHSNSSQVKLIVYNRVIPQTGMDAFIPLPTEYGSQEFYVICFKPPTGKMQVSVVPLGVTATVTYTMPPSNPVTIENDNGHFNGITSFAALQQHSTSIIFQEAHLFDSASNLNGMKITSNQLIHVFASSSLSYYSTILDADFTQNAMVPVKYWSVSYLVKIQNVYSDRIYITSASNSTSINIAAETTSQYCYFFDITTPGQFINMLAREPSYYIYASNPIAVAHLIVPPSQSYSMYMVTPIESFISADFFFIPSYFQLMTNRLTVYTNTTKTGNATLNNSPLTGSWSVIPGSGFSAVTVTVQTNTLYTVATSGGGVIGGYVHGTWTAESYSYPLSTYNRNLQTGCGGSNCYQSTTFDFATCPPAPVEVTTTTPTPTIFLSGLAATIFCSNVGTRFYLGTEFLGSANLTIIDSYRPTCPCNCTPIISANATILLQRLAELRARLTINVKDTGAYWRTKTCAEDKRPSSAAMGSICSISLISLIAFVIIIDMRKLMHDGRHCRRLIRDEYRTKCGDPPIDKPLDDPQEDLFCLEKMPHVVI